MALISLSSGAAGGSRCHIKSAADVEAKSSAVALLPCKVQADLNSTEVGQVLVNLGPQLGRHLENGAVVLHHEGDQFCGEEFVQVHLVYGAQNAVGEHLDHLDSEQICGAHEGSVSCTTMITVKVRTCQNVA